ncbi:hypothetical protein AGMMS49983_02170 [Clostridia bacterium]|nr:hypothetical protein AGMMS49983_02170 [Clostridia bacterium]
MALEKENTNHAGERFDCVKPNNARLHAIVVIAVFVIVVGGFFVLNRVVIPPEISESERRPLAKLPELTADTFVSSEYMADFETWAADSFAFREPLRTLRAETVFRVFLQSDKSGLYLGDSGAGKFDKIREDAWRRSCGKIRILAERLAAGNGAGLRETSGEISGELQNGPNIYAAIVPDKSIYAGKWMPGFEEDLARDIFAEELPKLTQIDLAAVLTGADFYHTDLHWSQTQLTGVMDAFAAGMNFTPPDRMGFTVPECAGTTQEAGQFFGVYVGQLAMPMPPDDLTYVPVPDNFTNSSNPIGGVLSSQTETPEAQSEISVRVMYLDPSSGEMEEGPLYDFPALSGGDPYNFFLKGPQPLIVLEAADAAAGSVAAGESTGAASEASASPDSDASGSGRELILFRDSFGSSLAPLFLGPYSKVTLIDLRYIDSRVLDQYVSFPPTADILFLYSSQVLNNPDILLIK